MRAEQLLRIDASAELQRLCSARLQGSWQVPAELVRLAVARSARSLRMFISSSSLDFEAEAMVLTDQELVEVGRAMHPRTSPERRHRALLDLERRAADPLLFLAALNAEQGTITASNGRELFELDVNGNGRPRRRVPNARWRGVRIRLDKADLDGARARSWMRRVCRFVPIVVEVNDEALPRGFQGGLFKISVREPLPAEVAVSRSGDAPRLDLLNHGVLATRATVPGFPAFDAAVEMSPVAGPAASSVRLRELVTPRLPELIDQAIGMMVRIVPRLPGLDEPGRRRIVALLLQAARQDIRRDEIIGLEMIEQLGSDGQTVCRTTVKELLESDRRGGERLSALGPEHDRCRFDLFGGRVLLLGSAERGELSQLLEREIQLPPGVARPRARERLVAGLKAMIRAFVGVGSRLAAAVGPAVLPPSELEVDERNFLLELTGCGARWADGRGARWGLRAGRGRARKTGTGALTVSFARQDPDVRRAITRVAVDPSWLYPCLCALAPPADLDLDELRDRWLQESVR